MQSSGTPSMVPQFNQIKPLQNKSHSTSVTQAGITTCPYHYKNYVAYCMLHKELMCEECCDLAHHKDHNTQILLLKAAAQSFLKDVDLRLNEVMQAQRV